MILAKSISRNDKRLVLGVEKNQSFLELSDVILKELSIKNWSPFRYNDDETDEVLITDIISLPEQYMDYSGKDFHLQYFFASKKIIVVLLAKQSIQDRFIDAVSGQLEWKKSPHEEL